MACCRDSTIQSFLFCVCRFYLSTTNLPFFHLIPNPPNSPFIHPPTTHSALFRSFSSLSVPLLSYPSFLLDTCLLFLSILLVPCLSCFVLLLLLRLPCILFLPICFFSFFLAALGVSLNSLFDHAVKLLQVLRQLCFSLFYFLVTHFSFSLCASCFGFFFNSVFFTASAAGQ